MAGLSNLLRIELDINEQAMPAVAALPWEFMRVPRDANLGTLWLGTASGLIFSHRRAQWHVAPPIPPQESGHALGGGTNPPREPF